MKYHIHKYLAASILTVCLFLLLANSSQAWEPSDAELDRAIGGGDFGGYFAEVSAWIDKKVQGDVSEAMLDAKLDDPVFAHALAARQLILKVGANPLADYARDGQKNKEFLTWLLKNTEAIGLFLEGATPVGITLRAQNQWTVPVAPLRVWQQIYRADPESRAGLYLKLAVAVSLNPPGTGNQGAGQAKQPPGPVSRYLHYKTAHKNRELFPSFDHRTVWEFRQIVSSNASNEDLAWVREMIRTWRPDLLDRELVVNSTSDVWRRFSPFPFDDTFKNVIAGGGKCGPRSSWSVFICQAFGLPAVGVRQPGHACAAYKSAYPEVQPQPGNAWKVVYGRGWEASKACGLAGPDFMEEMKVRSDAAAFSKVEHLRWLASALTSDDRKAAVMKVAEKIERQTPTVSPSAPNDHTDSPDVAKPEPPWKPVPGVIHILAADFDKMGGQVSYQGLQFPGVLVHRSATGGKQIHFQSNMQNAWAEYVVDIPADGTYLMTMQTAAVNYDQRFEVSVAGKPATTVAVPMSTGLWAVTPAVELQLAKGPQTIRISAGFQRRVSVKWLELTAK